MNEGSGAAGGTYTCARSRAALVDEAQRRATAAELEALQVGGWVVLELVLAWMDAAGGWVASA
jgi:hypothetical protein